LSRQRYRKLPEAAALHWPFGAAGTAGSLWLGEIGRWLRRKTP